MKKPILSIAAVLISMSAKADVIKCVFTEPFIDFTYSMTQSTMTIKDAIANDKLVKKNISFQIKGPGQFELWDAKNNIVAQLNLDNKGSDGMSEISFPYSANWIMPETKGMKNMGPLYGGCTSNFQQATDAGN